MDFTDDERSKFVKVHYGGIESLIDLVAERRLQLRDVAVLVTLGRYCSWKSGRIKVTPQRIAERLRVQKPHVISSLTRLKEQGLVKKLIDGDTGDWYYLFDPDLASVGRPQVKGLLRHLYAGDEE